MTTTARYGVDLDTEKIQREALLVLFDHLNDKMEELEEQWLNEDADLYNRMGRVAPDWSVEPIPIENFLPGTLAPLMSRPKTEYPNVCTIAYIADPTGSSDDEGELYQVRLRIEVMVKSELNEQEVNSRIQKVMEAIHRVFIDSFENRKLNGAISDMGRPRQTIGSVFKLRQDSKDWYWQGGSLEYPVIKYVSQYNQ